MKQSAALLLAAIATLHSQTATAAGCASCVDGGGGFVSIEQANQLVSASTVTTAVASALGILSVAGAAGNIGYAIKGEHPSTAWGKVVFTTGGAAIVLGSCSAALGLNLRGLANDVTPFEAQPGVTKAGNVALALGLASVGAGLLNVGMGVLAFVKPEASTFVTEGQVGFAPVMVLDRQNNIAPGLGATFVLR